MDPLSRDDEPESLPDDADWWDAFPHDDPEPEPEPDDFWLD